MSKFKILNKYQRSNLSVLDTITVTRLRRGDWRNNSSGLLQCVSCGSHSISTYICRFFQYDGSKLLCYSCQRNPKNTYEQCKSINASQNRHAFATN